MQTLEKKKDSAYTLRLLRVVAAMPVVGESNWVDAAVDRTPRLVLTGVVVIRSCVKRPIHSFTIASQFFLPLSLFGVESHPKVL